MKKSMYLYLSLLGLILAIGLVFLINTGDDDTTEETNESTNTDEELFNQDAVEALEESIEVVASDDGSVQVNNLFIPWTINKSGNTFFLSQRDGTVIQIDGDFGLVDVQHVDVMEEILHEGEGGFLGFTLAPDFETSNRALAYHTYEKDSVPLNRIVSLILEGDTWKEEDVLVDGIPGGEINNGGRIQVGPDGLLYATTGDTGQANFSQDLDSLAGKILRMELDGTIPEDNPFNDSYVFSYGHRNPQGFAWDSEGTLYSSEHGDDGHDEINVIEAGKNYGWPLVQGDEKEVNMVSPIFHSGEDTWAPSGMAYNDGQLYIASLAGQKIFTYDIADGTINDFFDNVGRLRDVMIEDDALYTITNNHDSRGNPEHKDDRLINLSLTEKANTTE
ncbi:quinoprotein glucose dehydrogenase [Ornithinibacillus sp. L9]|uniref:Quinoprotein glucose dehydrogenase n=1 Tax=Ornithinibacillus caprae TaxID=2678566 RepID=A0A6N8FE99_9BACI|nr:quinoprotein glucose dehydrogenase [Ornithinibacillus caprae]